MIFRIKNVQWKLTARVLGRGPAFLGGLGRAGGHHLGGPGVVLLLAHLHGGGGAAALILLRTCGTTARSSLASVVIYTIL